MQEIKMLKNGVDYGRHGLSSAPFTVIQLKIEFENILGEKQVMRFQ